MLSPRFLPRIDRFFARNHLMLALMVTCSLSAIIVVADVFQKMDEFTSYAQRSGEGIGVVLWMLIKYYATFTPSLVLQWMIPLIMLLSAVICVTISSINNEYTVLRASGISMQRSIIPLLVVTFAVSYLVAWTRDYMVPAMVSKSYEISNQVRQRQIHPLQVDKRHRDQFQFVSMGHFNGKTGEAHNIRIEIRNVDKYYAGNDGFTAYEAQLAYLRDYTPVDASDNQDDQLIRQWVPANDLRAEKHIRGKYRNIKKEWTEPILTGITEAMLERQALGDAIMKSEDLEGLSDDRDIKIEQYRRSSEPWVSFTLVLVGLSLVLRQTARGHAPNYIKNIVVAVLLCAVFYVVRMSFISLGEAQWIWPFFAGWTPNLIFGSIGVLLFLKLED